MLFVATPIITTHPKSEVRKVGETKLFLNCSAYGYGGDVKYRWEKYQPSSESWLLPPYQRSKIISPILRIFVVKNKDEGIYRCTASNDDGIAVSKNATITVYGEYEYVDVL